MNVYSHVDRTDEMAAVSKLPSLLGTPIYLAAKPTVKSGDKSESVQSRQYIGSTSKAEDATLGQNLATADNSPKKPRPKEHRRKSLPEKGLAAKDSTGQSVSGVSSAGVEPTTFGFGVARAIPSHPRKSKGFDDGFASLPLCLPQKRKSTSRLSLTSSRLGSSSRAAFERQR